MSQANRRITTLTMLDAIAPNRTRFTVITNPSPARDAKKAALKAALDAIDARLAAGAPSPVPLAPRNPYINHYGKILDPVKSAQWQMEAVRKRQEENPAPAYHVVRDMPRCQWASGHSWDSNQCCEYCGQPRTAVR